MNLGDTLIFQLGKLLWKTNGCKV